MTGIREHFRPILSDDQILDSGDDLAFYGHDVCMEFAPNASAILFPTSHEQVLNIVGICNKHGIAIVPSGGRTGSSGGATATASEVVVSMVRLNKIKEVNGFDQTIVCEAGVTTENVQRRAEEHGLFYPMDFYSKGSSCIGGNIATNAGGLRVIRYGNTRDWVLGLKVVTGAGEELFLNGSLFKNQTGYDLRQLFIGSEGTLGLITEATLLLTTPPGDRVVVLAALEQPQHALECLKRFRHTGLVINAFEYFERNGLDLVIEFASLPDPFKDSYPCYLLIEADISNPTSSSQFQTEIEALLSDSLLADAVIGQNSKHNAQLFSYRELISEASNQIRVPHKNDISVPVPTLPEFLAQLKSLVANSAKGYEAIIFGHVGDGNIHINMLKPESISAEDFWRDCKRVDKEIFALISSFRGSISAEHGVGLLKKSYLNYSRSAEEVSLMKGIKRLFDPNNILNPGKIFELP